MQGRDLKKRKTWPGASAAACALRRAVVAFGVFGMVLLWLGTAQAGSLLTLFNVQSAQGAAETPWWTLQDRRLSSIERALVDDLLTRKFDVIDPQAMSNPPKVSRIYRVPRLSRSNAINLAGLYGASRVMVGKVAHRVLEDPVGVGLQGAESVAVVQILDVSGGQMLLEATVRRQAWASDADTAATRAQALLAADLGSWMAGAVAGLNPPVGVVRQEPFLVVRGLWDKAAMDTVIRALRQQPEIEAVSVAWLTEGAVAFDLNPGSEQTPAVIASAAERLKAEPPQGILLSIEDTRSGAVELLARRDGAERLDR